jgi:hypothetical protein
LVTSTIGFGLLIAAAGASTTGTLLGRAEMLRGHRPSSARNSHAGAAKRVGIGPAVAPGVSPVEIKPVEHINSSLTAAS